MNLDIKTSPLKGKSGKNGKYLNDIDYMHTMNLNYLNSTLAYMTYGRLKILDDTDLSNIDKYIEKLKVINITDIKRTFVFKNEKDELVYISVSAKRFQKIFCGYNFLYNLLKLLNDTECSYLTKLGHFSNFATAYKKGIIKDSTMKHIITLYRNYNDNGKISLPTKLYYLLKFYHKFSYNSVCPFKECHI